MMLVMMVAREHFVLVQSLTLDESKKNVGTRRDWISKSSLLDRYLVACPLQHQRLPIWNEVKSLI